MQKKITSFPAKLQPFSATGEAFGDLTGKSRTRRRKSGARTVFPTILNPKKCVLKEQENKSDDSES
jgi:hypothetical protein